MAVTREIAQREQQKQAEDRLLREQAEPGKVFYAASLTGHGALDLDNNAGLRIRRYEGQKAENIQLLFYANPPHGDATFADVIAMTNHRDGEIRAFLEAMVNLAAHYGITTETAAGFSGSRLHPEDIKEAAEAVDAMEFVNQKFQVLKNKGMQEIIGGLLSTPLEPAVVEEIHKTVNAYLEKLKSQGPIYGSFDHLMRGSDVA